MLSSLHKRLLDCCNSVVDDHFMDLSCSGEDGKVLGEAVDDKKEDGGGGDDEQQPLLVPLPVLGRDHSGADGDEEAGGEGDLQCEPVHDARLFEGLRFGGA